ncbi:UNVERIFIED_CONTAM: hypothetical protein K2H54_034312 [Gekko kuhli]
MLENFVGIAELVSKRKHSPRIVGFVVLTLVLVPLTLCKVPLCPITDPLPILHKYYKSGDLIIAGIMSQIYIDSNPITFENRPSEELFDDLFQAHQNLGILHLLLYFKWTWIGVITLNDDTGERFVQDIVPMLSQNGICFDFITTMPPPTFFSEIEKLMSEGAETYKAIMGSTAKVLVQHGEIQTMIVLRVFLRLPEIEDIPVEEKGKIWIFTAQMDFTSLPVHRNWDIGFVHGALSFAVHSVGLSGFQNFLQEKNLTSEKEDGFIRQFWQQAFLCSLSNNTIDAEGGEICTGEERLKDLPGSVFETTTTAHSYNVYNGVYAVVHALKAMWTSRFKYRATIHAGRRSLLDQAWWQNMTLGLLTAIAHILVSTEEEV